MAQFVVMTTESKFAINQITTECRKKVEQFSRVLYTVLIWLDGVVVTAMELRSTDTRFDSHPLCRPSTTALALDKLLAHIV